ncbi:exodeoxyribonuclease VII large subunit [Bacteroidales bacterium OttesenSCG-928-I14]|nr:exodeoxyribonuclease VII large subunit [Bacteroidales bacterium OttesenSCG-928-I14]
MKSDFLTLSQLSSFITEAVDAYLPDNYWVLAETSDVRYNKNGHCYLELIEKKEGSEAIVSKARANIWSNVFGILKPYFESKTGQAFVSGIKVLVKVAVNYHPVYGLGLNIMDIDPTYTLGDIERKRQEILKRLSEDGVLTLNKELELPLLPHRIAIITSSTAAGYEDFLDHLINNPQGLVFYNKLFPAVMQGEQTEKSIINALEKIYEHRNLFDVVVIIRGGGASSDLTSFDSYLLASHCAQFPMPIITGIGHERDNTILDEIAFHRAKTPTAVADYLISKMQNVNENLEFLKTGVINGVNQNIRFASENLFRMTSQLPLNVNRAFEKENLNLKMFEQSLRIQTTQFLKQEEAKLKDKESFFKLSSPEYILSKGYSITYKDGKAIKSSDALAENDEIETLFHQGSVKSRVMKS